MSDSSENWHPRAMPALLISTAARFLGRLADIRFRDLNISTSQFPVLMALKGGARLSQKELTRFAGVEQPSMAQLLARMERDGLIKREPDPSDGRSSLISMSDLAREKLGPARAILAQGNRDALVGFDDAEVEQLLGFLRRIILNLSDGADCSPKEQSLIASFVSNHLAETPPEDV